MPQAPPARAAGESTPARKHAHRPDQTADGLFRKIQPHEYVCSTWFERDRAHVSLSTPKGRVVFELWDDDVLGAIESGYLKPPRVPRPGDHDWQPSAVQYAFDMGLIPPR